MPEALLYVILGAMLAGAIPFLVAGTATGFVGSAGVGLVTEDARKFAPAVILQALPQTQGFYGLIVAILILMGSGMLAGAPKPLTPDQGMAALLAGVIIAITGLTSIPQGYVAASGIQGVARNPAVLGRAVVFAVMVETFAILGLLVSILILFGAGFFG